MGDIYIHTQREIFQVASTTTGVPSNWIARQRPWYMRRQFWSWLASWLPPEHHGERDAQGDTFSLPGCELLAARRLMDGQQGTKQKTGKSPDLPDW